LFADDAIDEAAAATGLGPRRSELLLPWLADVQALLTQATLVQPAVIPFISTGTQGVHSEHMGFILAEMQSVQRRFPGGAW
jgi:ring-1,2-phenylacetyl-CoA epoxidase subunit PaaC